MRSALTKSILSIAVVFYLVAINVAAMHVTKMTFDTIAKHSATSLESIYEVDPRAADSCHNHANSPDSIGSIACELFCAVTSQAISADSIDSYFFTKPLALSGWTQHSLFSVLPVIEPRPPKVS